jgi:soluble lytic murein transglycosylase-like protein
MRLYLIALIIVIIFLVHKSEDINKPIPRVPHMIGPLPSKSFADLAFEYGARYSLDPFMLLGIMKRESQFKPEAISPPNTNGTRDYGLMQINSGGFEELGVNAATVLVAEINVEAACKLLQQKRTTLVSHFGSVTDSQLISSYNQGEGNVINHGIKNWPYVAYVQFWRFIFKLRKGEIT